MNDHGKSDRSVVPTKPRNKGGSPPADGVEGRGRTKENTVELNPCQTPSWASGQNRLDGVRQAAQRDKRLKFTALLHHVNTALLRDSYYRLERHAAPGVDRVTWAEYGEDLEARLAELHGRIHRGAYRAQPSRRVYIPKSDGRKRPLGIAALEDKIVQQAVRRILEQIYEEDFLGFSYGFRPGRSQHDALDALSAGIVWKKVNWILDADIRGFFDHLDHEWLVKFLEHRIGDRRIIRLIRKWLKAGVLEEGIRRETQEGTPQGAVISPLLSNLYLHYVLDLWVESWRKKEARGDVIIVRYADDFVMGFQYREEAERFQRQLAKRLGQFGLELHPEKTRLIEFGRFAAAGRKKRGKGKPETFDFLGFTHVCGRTRKNASFEVKRRTIAKRLRKKLQEIKQQLKWRRHESTVTQTKWLKSVVQGYYQYHAIPGNWEVLDSFRRAVLRLWRHALRRRSQRSRWTWHTFYERLAPAIPWPRIIHPYPLERFTAKHPR